MSLAAGTRLGPYEIVAAIGAGGMGEVYKARDSRLGRDVAIKVIAALSAEDPDRRHRFEREARAIAALNHPNILSIYDVGEMAEGGFRAPYLVTELLEGETLRSRMEAGAFSPRKAIEIAIQIVAGLAAAHARGLVHRDLKPDNVFLTRDGQVKILDFGLAKAWHLKRDNGRAEAVQETMTGTIPGLVVGTVGYMSPEQVRGRDADPRSDMFSFGVILYEMVSGRRAFHGASPADTLSAVLHQDLPGFTATSTLAPPALERLIRRCLEKDADERFQGARDLRFALEAISAETDVRFVAPPTGSGEATTEGSTLPATGSIAVLPFTDMSPQRDQAYFCEGMAEEIMSALTRVDGLRVAARSSTFQAKQTGKDLRDIARLLDVSTIVEGSVRTAGSRLRVAAQLVDVSNGRAIWADKYDGDAGDVFAIQDAITEKIVAALTSKFLDAPSPPVVRRYTDNLEAYHAYLLGRHHRFSTYRLADALTAFEHAVALDPNHAPAWAGISYTLAVMALYGAIPPAVARQRAHEAVRRALEIDSDLPDAHFANGYGQHVDRDFDGARRSFAHVMTLRPSDFNARIFLAFVDAELGRSADARRGISLAQSLEPLSPFGFAMEAMAELLLQDFARAETAAAQARDLLPDFRLSSLAGSTALVRLSRFDEAMALTERAVQTGGGATYLRCQLGWVYGMAGRTDRAEEILGWLDEQAKGDYVSAYWRAMVLGGLGRHEQAMDALDTAIEENSQSLVLLCSAWWLELRPYPRYQAMLVRLGLPLISRSASS